MNSINDFIAICLISLFVTFVMITGGIDIQAGSIVGLTSIVIGVFWQDFGLNIWGAVLLAVAIAAVCGALSGFFVAYCGVQAMVVTLGGQFLYAGLALLVSTLSSTESYQGISGFPESFKALTGFKLFGVIPSQVLIFLGMTVIAWLLLHKSKYGRKVFLVGVNPQAAEYSGINTRRVILSTYVLSAVSARWRHQCSLHIWAARKARLQHAYHEYHHRVRAGRHAFHGRQGQRHRHGRPRSSSA